MLLLIKARKNARLVEKKVWVKHPKTGKPFQKTVWVLPGEEKSEKPSAVQEDLFSVAEFDFEQKEAPSVPEPETNDDVISDLIASATPETRATVQSALFGNDPAEAVRTPFSFTPADLGVEAASELGLQGFFQSYLDYRDVPPSEIHVYPKRKILETELPTWIPEIPMKNFLNAKWWLPIKDHGDGTYTLFWESAERDESVIRITMGKDSRSKHAARMSLDLLVATLDYYAKRSAAEQSVKYDAKDKELREKYRQIAVDFRHNKGEAILDDPRLARELQSFEMAAKEARYKRSRASMLGENRITYEQADLLTGTRVSRYGSVKSEVWDAYRTLRNSIRQKADDLEIQQEEWESSFGKGRETAYGDRGARPDLLESHGVMVKRQNGDEITPEEVTFIKESLDQLWNVYGDRSQMARKFGLKISHSGDVLMHARKAVGIFFPYYHAIGVSQKYGPQDFGFTLAHEWAHFMDHYIGKTSGRNFASDDYGSTAGQIASVFRDNMAQEQKSKYQTRTCECFARAFEQYFATKSGTAEDYQRDVNTEGNHPEQHVFERTVMPIIDRFFVENDEILKSMRVPVVGW